MQLLCQAVSCRARQCAAVSGSEIQQHEGEPVVGDQRRILVITADALGQRMAGPAIRAFEIAKALAAVGPVTLASTAIAVKTHPGIDIVDVSGGGLRPLVAKADVVIVQGHVLQTHPWIIGSGATLVVDIYDPMHLEDLEQSRALPMETRLAHSAGAAGVLNHQILVGDFFVCASERQRDFWLGNLGALGRLNPLTYDADPSLRSLIDVVPFGVQDEPPTQRRHAIKGTVPGIGPDDRVIIWGGGIYNWFDPLSLIRAVHLLSERRPDVRLFFLGGRHPNPGIPTMRMAYDALKLATELGALDRTVFFNEAWVEYDERADYLLDADIGVSTHGDHIETEFSFRTRMLDYLWAGLPMLSTRGDGFADLIERDDLGATVPAHDVAAIADALDALLSASDDEHAARRARVRAVAEAMRWELVLEPLVRYVRDGRRAPDLEAGIPLGDSRKVAALEDDLRQIRSSTSWRLTAGLRWCATTVRRAVRAR